MTDESDSAKLNEIASSIAERAWGHIDYLLALYDAEHAARLAAEQRVAELKAAFAELDERLRVQSLPLVEVFNLIAAGGTPTQEQLRKAQDSYKWAVYGTAIAAQIQAMPSISDGDAPAHGEGSE